MRWVTAILIAIACQGSQKALAQALAVDLELVLAVDGSRSIDDGEFELQLQGIARAFLDRGFLSVLRSAAPQGIAVTLVQWTGDESQAQVVGWHHVMDETTAADFSDRVLAGGRRLYPGPTAIGSAIRFSTRLIDANGFAGRRRVIDISGDGYNNSGNRPELARDEALARGVIVNGLTVMNEIPALDQYFLSRVVGGPGAFVIEALDFEHFADAFKLKLIREVRGSWVSLLMPNTRLASE